jgi:diapolycopene oxygenase
MKRIVIIGGGLGGLAAAIRLARQGHSITLIEKNAELGGKLDTYSHDGIAWDIGATSFTMPFALRELFECTGQELENFLYMKPVDPIRRCFFTDGTVLNQWSNPHLFQIEIARREKDRGQALDAYYRYAKGMYELYGEKMLFSHTGDVRSRALKKLLHFPKRLSVKSMSESTRRFFKEPHVQRLFIHYATHFGASPTRLPSMAHLLAHLEHQGGCWTIRGGMSRIIGALEKLALDLKVEIYKNTEATEILTRASGGFQMPQVKGVSTSKGRVYDADLVICNLDVTSTWARLLEIPKKKRRLQQYERRSFSTSAFVILCSLRKMYDELATQNLFFSEDWKLEQSEIFEKKLPPQDPTIELSVLTALSDSNSGQGSEEKKTPPPPKTQRNTMVRIHVRVPALEPDHHWQQKSDAYRERIFAKLERMGLKGFREEIDFQKTLTPSDFALRHGSYRGAIFGHVPTRGSIWNKPQNQSTDVEGLYFVGDSTRPGGGIPFTLLSAEHVAADINRSS